MSNEDVCSISYTTAPTAADRDGVCVAQQLAEAGNLVIAGALAAGGIATFGEQQRVTLYSAGDLSGITFTVYGTTTFGDSISEAVTGPNNTTVSTTANFKRVTRVAASAVVGTNVEVGNSNALETPWVMLMQSRPLKGISVELTGATLTYEVQYAARERLTDAETAVMMLADTSLTAKTANAGLVASIPWPMVRLKITGFAAGTATLRVIECPA